MFFKLDSQFGQLGKSKTQRRIKIKNNIIRKIELRRSNLHLVKFDAGEVCKPDESGFFCRHHVILRFRPENNVINPIWSPFRSVFLEERFASDSIGKADNGKWSAF